MIDPVAQARSAAWLAARNLSGDERAIASNLLRTAELAVLRQLLSAQLPGGEAQFWMLVEVELKSRRDHE